MSTMDEYDRLRATLLVMIETFSAITSVDDFVNSERQRKEALELARRVHRDTL